MDIVNEIWKDITGYEGMYQVSNFGRVKSLSRVICGNKVRKGIFMKQSTTNKGYLRTYLCKNGIREAFATHRLVANHFLQKVDSKELINHKDGNKKNNFYSNLEWVTPKENTKHAWDVLRITRKKGFDSPCSKGVMQVSVDGFLIGFYGSQAEAEENTGVSRGNICSCLLGKRPKAGGYLWF